MNNNNDDKSLLVVEVVSNDEGHSADSRNVDGPSADGGGNGHSDGGGNNHSGNGHSDVGGNNHGDDRDGHGDIPGRDNPIAAGGNRRSDMPDEEVFPPREIIIHAQRPRGPVIDLMDSSSSTSSKDSNQEFNIHARDDSTGTANIGRNFPAGGNL